MPCGIPFRVIWDVVWILIALIAIRIARLGVQVDRLIIRGCLRTRTFDASQISDTTLVTRAQEIASLLDVQMRS